jgi:hypothetical protein
MHVNFPIDNRSFKSRLSAGASSRDVKIIDRLLVWQDFVVQGIARVSYLIP